MPSLLTFQKTWVSLPADWLRSVLPVLSYCHQRGTLPILGHVLVTYKNGRTTLAITDLDQGIEVHYSEPKPLGIEAAREAAVAWRFRNGSATIPLADLKEIATKADKGTSVRIDWTGAFAGEAQYVVKKANLRRPIESLDPSEYPPLPAMPDLPVHEQAERTFIFDWPPGEHCALAKVAPAMSDDETRYVLNGAFRASNEWVATDGRTLRLAPSAGEDPAPNFILPSKSAPIQPGWAKFIGDRHAFAYAYDDSHLHLDWQDGRWFTKLVEGNYPNYRQVIPTGRDHQITVVFDEDALPATIETIRSMLKMKSPSGKALESICIEIKADGTAWLQGGPANDPTVNYGLVGSVMFHKATFKPFRIAINGHWFANFLRDGFTRWTMQDEMSPLYSAMPNGLIGVAMPMRVA